MYHNLLENKPRIIHNSLTIPNSWKNKVLTNSASANVSKHQRIRMFSPYTAAEKPRIIHNSLTN